MIFSLKTHESSFEAPETPLKPFLKQALARLYQPQGRLRLLITRILLTFISALTRIKKYEQSKDL